MKFLKKLFKSKNELPPPLPVLDKNIQFLYLSWDFKSQEYGEEQKTS